MRQIAEYDVYIFDCDGVILDSNQLKIDAMKKALELMVSDKIKVKSCVDYFRNNFGKSRFHHIDIFIEKFLFLDECDVNGVKQKLLTAYSSQCKELYLLADLTPGFIGFIEQLEGGKYIASGSVQSELRDVFEKRGLDKYFDGIYGSPTKKSELVTNILKFANSRNAIMFGDAISDFEASKDSNIDFVGYLPFSNVKDKVLELSEIFRFKTIKNWSEI